MQLHTLLCIIDHRVVPTDRFERTTSTGISLLYGLDAIEGPVTPSAALETDSYRHTVLLQPYISGNSG
jgi:hypothetical protein